eukprot:symbB.v1.2.020764.t1/scaffold1749.1/size103200/4
MASCRPSLDLTRAELGLPALKRQFPHLEVDVLAAFLDDAEGAGLSDESFVALMDRLGACGGKALTRLFLA